MSKAVEQVKVVPSDPPVEREVLADAIVKLSAAIQRLDKSGLNRRAIVVLIQDDTKLRQRDIEAVLNSAANLQRRYCK